MAPPSAAAAEVNQCSRTTTSTSGARPGCYTAGTARAETGAVMGRKNHKGRTSNHQARRFYR
ncbi:MAG: hypothetical protein V3V06_01910, partial [Dehalococcoidia bacterium]